jgi:hypothetical protein
MKSRYELTISTNYVPDWTYIEGIRELFQNALDNEIKTPANKMGFSYDNVTEVLRISNKTSALEVDSLLLGSSTKTGDTDTIGQHGEGYKIAFMVLLREGKKIRVYNYGKREVWEARLVKSKRYRGSLVPVITIEKEVFWRQEPDNDLIIEVAGISNEEYDAIVKSNLNLQENVEHLDIDGMGKILLDKKEKGRVYVHGLYICNKEELKYGYSFSPSIVKLDRDRRLLSALDVAWETSLMWKRAYRNGVMLEEIMDMIERNVTDVMYMASRVYTTDKDVDQDIANSMAARFIAKNGKNCIPVASNEELNMIKNSSVKPVIVNRLVKGYLDKADNIKIINVPKELSIHDEFQLLLNDIEYKLTSDEEDRFKMLIDKL